MFDLDQEHIGAAARWAAERLDATGVARVRLAPGDMTEYRIMIAAPDTEWAYGDERDGRYHWVALASDFGRGYEWHGGTVSPDYAAEKWAAGRNKATRAHTGRVVADFLTALAKVPRGGQQ